MRGRKECTWWSRRTSGWKRNMATKLGERRFGVGLVETQEKRHDSGAMRREGRFVSRLQYEMNDAKSVPRHTERTARVLVASTNSNKHPSPRLRSHLIRTSGHAIEAGRRLVGVRGSGAPRWNPRRRLHARSQAVDPAVGPRQPSPGNILETSRRVGGREQSWTIGLGTAVSYEKALVRKEEGRCKNRVRSRTIDR
jgi:hypothetical protein